MDAFITRRGGGGTSLNFSVVGGTTQPENPKENTIWVNTDQEITGWSFSATEPTDPYEGLVWLVTNLSNSKTFNVLRKNELCVYVSSVRQYSSGSWAKRGGCQVFSDEVWSPIQNGWLYNEGDECTALTGGWSGYKYAEGSTNASGSYTKYDTSLYMYASYTAGDYGYVSGFVTNSAVDISQFSTLRAIIKVTSPSKKAKMMIGNSVNNVKLSGTPIASCSFADVSGQIEVAIPLDGVTQNVFIGIGLWAGAACRTPSAHILKVWLE